MANLLPGQIFEEGPKLPINTHWELQQLLSKRSPKGGGPTAAAATCRLNTNELLLQFLFLTSLSLFSPCLLL